jgi:thermostable 8-oxoguanine DNA glycosylase
MASVFIELPPAQSEVISGVVWGAVEAFPTPAYWAYQVFARRLEGRVVRYRLGNSLREELGACLLGGHGIRAAVGLAAFEHLRAQGAFDGKAHSEERLFAWLSDSLCVGGRTMRYRFARQKAHYLASALSDLGRLELSATSGKALRNALLALPGVGYKTASWVARNWLDADDVAILDIHIFRAGVVGGFLDPSLTVERNYEALEDQFLAFSAGLGVRASELDAVIWLEMASAPRSVQSALSSLPESGFKSKHISPRRSQNRRADSDQLALLA